MADHIKLPRAVVREALEFLERGDFLYPAELSDNFRAALAEPVQEPVACKTLCELCVKRGYTFCANAVKTTPINTPPQRKPLTEEEIERACVPLGAAMLSFTEVARAIEAAHGIKENT